MNAHEKVFRRHSIINIFISVFDVTINLLHVILFGMSLCSRNNQGIFHWTFWLGYPKVPSRPSCSLPARQSAWLRIVVVGSPLEQCPIVGHVVVRWTLVGTEILLLGTWLQWKEKKKGKKMYPSVWNREHIAPPTDWCGGKRNRYGWDITCILQILYRTASPLQPWGAWQRRNWYATPPSQDLEHVDHSVHDDQPWAFARFWNGKKEDLIEL